MPITPVRGSKFHAETQIGLVWVCSRSNPKALPGAVGAYIAGGFWFTPTGFANPAVTVARGLTHTFAGIRLTEAPVFLAAELSGAIAAAMLFGWLAPSLPIESAAPALSS
jgi:glycerol uptake facilitator-like aquaporin